MIALFSTTTTKTNTTLAFCATLVAVSQESAGKMAKMWQNMAKYGKIWQNMARYCDQNLFFSADVFAVRHQTKAFRLHCEAASSQRRSIGAIPIFWGFRFCEKPSARSSAIFRDMLLSPIIAHDLSWNVWCRLVWFFYASQIFTSSPGVRPNIDRHVLLLRFFQPVEISPVQVLGFDTVWQTNPGSYSWRPWFVLATLCHFRDLVCASDFIFLHLAVWLYWWDLWTLLHLILWTDTFCLSLYVIRFLPFVFKSPCLSSGDSFRSTPRLAQAYVCVISLFLEGRVNVGSSFFVLLLMHFGATLVQFQLVTSVSNGLVCNICLLTSM